MSAIEKREIPFVAVNCDDPNRQIGCWCVELDEFLNYVWEHADWDATVISTNHSHKNNTNYGIYYRGEVKQRKRRRMKYPGACV